MKKIMYIIVVFLLISTIFIPQVKASETDENVVGTITEESRTVEQNGNVFVEMQIDNIEDVKSITGYIASTIETEKHIEIKLENTTQGNWYCFRVPSTTIIGNTYTIPMIKVEYNDSTSVTGKVSGEFQVIKNQITKILGSITEESKNVKQNGNVFVEMQIDNIEDVKLITGYIASKTDAEKHIEIELENTTQGNWYYFIVPSTTIIGNTYTIPMIKVEYSDGTTEIGKISGEFKLIEEKNSKNDNITKDDSDNTKAKTVLPKTGKQERIIMFITLVLISIILYFIFKRYQNIK